VQPGTIGNIEIVARLANQAIRRDAAQEIAKACGAEDLVVFLRDPEVGALLSAPGFPQTLPDGRLWRAFVEVAASEGEHRGELPLHGVGSNLPAIGYASGANAVVVMLGTTAPNENVELLRSMMPLIETTLRAEQTTALADAQARLARDASARAATLVQALDRTRRQLENTLEIARLARVEVEAANTQLQGQALELEAQTEELQSANTSLEEARAVADSANHAKSEFLATMSHELRTPLNAIGGYVELLSMGIHGAVNDTQQHALGRIDRSQRHLLGLINNVLNLSRIEAGRVDYDISDVMLATAFANIAPMIEPQLAAKGIAYELCDVDRLPRVSADAEKLQQILLNLLSNAVKFTDTGGRVWVEAGRTIEKPGQVFVRVSDTGRGVPADKLESIFEPFTQVDASHSRTGEGTGLGLAISRDLARGMGGDIRARSVLGGGSVFTLTLLGAVRLARNELEVAGPGGDGSESPEP